MKTGWLHSHNCVRGEDYYWRAKVFQNPSMFSAKGGRVSRLEVWRGTEADAETTTPLRDVPDDVIDDILYIATDGLEGKKAPPCARQDCATCEEWRTRQARMAATMRNSDPNIERVMADFILSRAPVVARDGSCVFCLASSNYDEGPSHADACPYRTAEAAAHEYIGREAMVPVAPIDHEQRPADVPANARMSIIWRHWFGPASGLGMADCWRVWQWIDLDGVPHVVTKQRTR